MKFKVNRDHFSALLAIACGLPKTSATLPILSHVRLEARKGKLTAYANNLDLAISAEIVAEVIEPGVVLMPGKRTLTMIRELPGLEVSINVSPNHQVKIESQGSTFRVNGMDAGEFPGMSERPEPIFAVKQDVFRRAIKAVYRAASNDEARFVLNSVYLDPVDGGYQVVATDGRRLQVIKLGVDLVPDRKKIPAIIPIKTIGVFLPLLGGEAVASVGMNEKQISLAVVAGTDNPHLVGEIIVQSKVIGGKYPNYLQVIPKKDDNGRRHTTTEREALHAAIHRTALVCTDKSNSVKFGFDGNTITMKASSPDFGDASDHVVGKGPQGQARESVIALNPKFILDVLEELPDDEIALGVADESLPLTVTAGGDFSAVLMPVRTS